MQRSAFIARHDLYAESQACVGHKSTVIAVRGASGFVGVVALHRALLFAVQAFDRRVEIQDPGCAQERLRGLGQVATEPRQSRRLIDTHESPTGGIF